MLSTFTGRSFHAHFVLRVLKLSLACLLSLELLPYSMRDTREAGVVPS